MTKLEQPQAMKGIAQEGSTAHQNTPNKVEFKANTDFCEPCRGCPKLTWHDLYKIQKMKCPRDVLRDQIRIRTTAEDTDKT